MILVGVATHKAYYKLNTILDIIFIKDQIKCQQKNGYIGNNPFYLSLPGGKLIIDFLSTGEYVGHFHLQYVAKLYVNM